MIPNKFQNKTCKGRKNPFASFSQRSIQQKTNPKMSSANRLALIRSLARSRGMLPPRPVMAAAVPSVHVWKKAPAPAPEVELPDFLKTTLANLFPFVSEAAPVLALPAPGDSSVSRMA